MSKSAGTGISPTHYPADLVRLWSAFNVPHGYGDDILFTHLVMRDVYREYRSLRRILRFLLANLYDFDDSIHSVPLLKMFPLDQWILANLFTVYEKIIASYKEWDYGRAMRTCIDFMKNTLRNGYLQKVKNRLYYYHPESFERRCAQSVMFEVLKVVVPLLAPVLSFMAEEVSDLFQKGKDRSIHLQHFVEPLNVCKILDANTANETQTQTQTQTQTPTPKATKKSGKEPSSYSIADKFKLIEESSKIVTKAMDEVKSAGGTVAQLILIVKDDTPNGKMWLSFLGQQNNPQFLLHELFGGVACVVEKASSFENENTVEEGTTTKRKQPRPQQNKEKSSVDSNDNDKKKGAVKKSPPQGSWLTVKIKSK